MKGLRQHLVWRRSLFCLYPFVVVFTLVGSAVQAASRISIGQTYYDYYPAGASDRIMGQIVTGVFPAGPVDLGISFEMARLRFPAAHDDFYNPGFVVEKVFRGGLLIGGGLGLVQDYRNGVIVMVSSIWEIYGKVTIIKAGRGEVRGFVGNRWVFPTPLNVYRVLRFGLEVGAGI